jgi:membrane fusion protein (multidrug efflux system)
MIRRFALGGSALLAIALFPSFHAVARAQSTATSPIAVRLATTGAANEGRLIAASVAPVSRATVSTRMAATVERVLVNEGSHVRRGQLLVVLSSDDVRAQLAAATTALGNATAYERRISDLVKSHAATPVELEGAQAQRAQAAAAVAAAKANLGYTQLRAPFDGTVQARRVNAGDFVGPGQPLVDVAGAGLELQATLSEDEAAGLAIGQQVRFQVNDQHGEAVLTALTAGADALSHRRTLRAKITTGTTDLRSGAFARIVVPGVAVAKTLRVPQTALVQRGDLTGVFIARDGRAQLRWLSVGDVQGPDVLVRAGLASGEAVIDNPGALRDEQPIQVVGGAQP